MRIRCGMTRFNFFIADDQRRELEALRSHRMSMADHIRAALDDYIAKLRRQAAKTTKKEPPR